MDAPLAAELLGLELALARRDSTAVPDGLPSLLDDDFEEFGASGRRWDRASVLAALAEGPADVMIKEFAAVRVADDVMLVTFRTVERSAGAVDRHARRSSLWAYREGRWWLRFHQGTPTDGDEPPRP